MNVLSSISWERLPYTARVALRGLAVVAVLTAATAAPALAQIYVVTEPDGTRRFTNQPVDGAEVYLRTYFTREPEPEVDRKPVPFLAEIQEAGRLQGIDARLIEAVIAQESAFDPKALSNKGAQGLMQLMPDTADRFGVHNVWDPKQNIAGGTAYLRWLIEEFDGDLRHVLAAYNAGEGAVTRYGGIPPYAETRAYVDKVITYYLGLGGGSAVSELQVP